MSAAPRVGRVVSASEHPMVDLSDPNAEGWIAAGGDPRDQGRMVEIFSRELTNAPDRLGIQPSEPHGRRHRLGGVTHDWRVPDHAIELHAFVR